MSIIEELKAFHSNPKKVEILTKDSILGRDISESTLLAIFRSACNHSFHYVGNTLFIQAVRSGNQWNLISTNGRVCAGKALIQRVR